MFWEEVMPEPGRVIVPKPISKIIAMPAELRLTFDGFNHALVRLNSKIVATQILRCRRRKEALTSHRPHIPAAISVSAVEPASSP